MRRAAGLVVAYGALVVALTWPLATRLGTHLPQIHVSSEYDALFLAWSLAYQTHALVTAPARFADGNIFHPHPHTVFYGETGFGALPFFAPAFLATGNAVFALNVMTLLCVTLTAAAIHLVVRRWTGSHAAGAVAATTLLFTRWVLPGGIAGAPNFAVLQYFPGIVYLASMPALVPARAAALGALVVLQGLTSVYMAAAVLLPLGLLVAWRIVRPATRRDGVRLGAVVVASALLLVPFYAGHAVVARENPALQQQSFFVHFTQEADLPWGPLSYWTPAAVPAAALALVALGLVVRRRRATTPRAAWLHGAFWTATGLFLALPPTGRWMGGARHIPLPPALLVPFGLYDALRVTDRLGVAALMGLGILAGLGFAECAARSGGGRRAAFALAAPALMLVEYLRGPQLPLLGRFRTHTYFATVVGFPPGVRVPSWLYIVPGFSLFRYPLEDVAAFRPERALRAVLDAPGGPVLEVPVGTGPGGSPVAHARAMFRSTFGWRPLLNGYSRFFPADFPAVMDLARRLPEPFAVAELRRRTQVELVVVHVAELSGAERAPWLALIDQGGRADLQLVARGASEVVFRVGDAS